MKIGNLEVYGVIYKITNKVNGKVYIGQTSRERGFKGRYCCEGDGIERVYNFHKKAKERSSKGEATRCNEYLLNSIIKYGFEAFEVIEVFDYAFSEKELNIKEATYITLYKSNKREFGYNFTTGGDRVEFSEDSKIREGVYLICLNDGKQYKSYAEASRYYNLPCRVVKKRCSKKYYSDIDNLYEIRFRRFKRPFKDGERYCACCGNFLKISTYKDSRTKKKKFNNKQKYCSKCAKEVARKKSRERKRKEIN